MSLLQLPQELLDNILDSILTNGAFESFVLTSKAAHRIGKTHIQRYNQLRRTWRFVPSSENSVQCPAALSIFEAIIREPQLAWFVEVLDLSGMPDLSRDDDDGNWQIENESILQQAKQLVLQSPAIKAAGQDPEGWMYAVHDDHDATMRALIDTSTALGEDDNRRRRWYHHRASWNVQTQHEFMQVIRTVVLLTLLPNLRDLTLPTSFGYITGHTSDGAPAYFLDLMHDMARQAHANPDERLPLSKLEKLRPFEEVEYQYSPKTGFTELAPFTILPRMTEMDLRNMIATNNDEEHSSSDEAGLTFKWPYGDLVSNLRILNLEACCMDPEGLGELLQHTPQLKSLSYTHHPKYRGVGVDWAAGDMIAMIQDNCSQSLESLRLGRHHTGESYWGSPRGRIPSLKRFQVLEDLVVPLELFGKEEGGLSQVLPATIKHVRLITDSYDPADTLREIWTLERNAAFQDPDAIQRLSLQTFEVLMHSGGHRFGGVAEPVAPGVQQTQVAGAQIVVVEHGRGGHCTCASPRSQML